MVNFNFFKNKEKPTGAATPEYRSVLTPPMPIIKVPKNENPDTRPVPPPNPFETKTSELDPPFDANVANKYSSNFIEGQAKELEDLIWAEVAEAAKRGEKSVHIDISNRPKYYSRTDLEEKIYKIVSKLDSYTYRTLLNIAHKFVKYNYTVEVINGKIPRYYINEDDEEKKRYRYDKSDIGYIKDFSISIYWYDDAIANPLYKYRYSEYLIKTVTEGHEYYKHSIKEEVSTLEDIIAEEEAECQETS